MIFLGLETEERLLRSRDTLQVLGTLEQGELRFQVFEGETLAISWLCNVYHVAVLEPANYVLGMHTFTKRIS